MVTELLCHSSNGKTIYFEPVGSHTATHFEDATNLRQVTIEALQTQVLTRPLEIMQIDMHRPIGVTDVVAISNTDEIVYAMRKLREDQGWVPFTKSQSSQPCSLLSLHLKQRSDGSYELASVWIGELDSPPFPQMQGATAESVPYWRKHAFAWGSQQIICGSERTDCPW